MFQKAANDLGYHPFPGPSANLPVQYKNPDGVTRGQCTYCGFCERFGCEVGAKADPTVTVIPLALKTGKFEIRGYSHAYAIKNDGKTGQSVLYFDASGRIQEQPADIIILAAYVFNNVRTLLMSKLGTPYDPVKGTGAVGRNYCYQTGGGGASGWFTGKRFKRYMGSGALVDGDRRLQRRQLRPLGPRVHRRRLDHVRADRREADPEPHDAAGHGAVRPRLEGRDPEVLRERHQRRLPGRVARVPDAPPRPRPELPGQLRQSAGPHHVRLGGERAQDDRVRGHEDPRDHEGDQPRHHLRAVPARCRRTTTRPSYQSTHNTGGAIMGADPATSVVNSYLQMWDAPNVFVVGACNFPQNAGFNPTGTVGALAYRAAEGILKYHKTGGSLV